MKLLVLFVLTISEIYVSGFILSTMTDVNTVLSFIDFAERALTPEEEAAQKIDEVFDKVLEVSERLDDIAESIDIKIDGIMKALARMEHMQKVNKAQDELAGYINRIDELYEEFLAYTDDVDAFQRKTIEEFIGVITSHDNLALSNTLNRMHALFVPKRARAIRGSILNLVLGIQDIESDYTCNNPQSIQQHMLQLYEMVVVSELKGFAIVNFAYSTLSVYEKTSYKKEHEKSSAQAMLRSVEYLNNTRAAMEKASRRYVRCNPKKWIPDTTFFELSHLYQGFVIGDDQTGKSCKDTDTTSFKECHHYDKSHKEATFIAGSPTTIVVWEWHNYCVNQRCRGHVHKCVWVGAPEVCEMEDRSPFRYEYVESSGVVYGEKRHCSGTKRNFPTTLRNGRSNMCLCECAEENANSHATRTVSLDPVVSDIKNNMVVTGIRITNKERMVRFEIEQGKLVDYGSLDDESVNWVPSVKYEYLEEGATGEWKQVNPDGTKKPLEFKKNYSFLWAKQRTLNLDDVYVPVNHVITGVKFVHDESTIKSPTDSSWNRNPLEIAVQATPIDYKKGKLIPPNEKPSKWITAKDVEKKDPAYREEREEIDIEEATNPLKAKRENERDSTPNQLVNFQMSNLDKDVGSFTIPFIDMQPLSPIKKAPLDGIGNFHKGTPGFGGFVAFQVFHIDYSNYIEAALTPDNVKLFETRTAAEQQVKSGRRRSRG